MKFSATFAVLAIFVSNAVVSAAPFRAYETDAVEARAEFVESALEEVWERFYDELLEEVEARDYEEDLFEARDFDDEEIFVRSPQMKKFAGDLASGLAGKVPGMVKQYQQGQDFQNRQKLPTFQQSMDAKKKAEAAAKAGKKRSFDDEDLFVRSPMKKFASDLVQNLAQKAPAMANQYSQGQQVQQRQQQPTFKQAMDAKKKAEAAAKSGKKRSFDDEEIFERSPMKKFASDLVQNLAQKAPAMANQYSQGQQAQQRQQQPTFKQAMDAKKKAEAAAKAGKKRSFDDEELFVRSPMKKFASDLVQNLAQKAPAMANQYSQGQQAQQRQQQPTFKQAMDAKKKAEAAAKSGKK